MSYARAGDAAVILFKFMFVLLCLFVPLGLWKLIDIAIWLYNNIHVQVGQ